MLKKKITGSTSTLHLCFVFQCILVWCCEEDLTSKVCRYYMWYSRVANIIIPASSRLDFPSKTVSPVSYVGTLQVYYASQVTDGNKRTHLNERFGEQAPEDTTATESDRYAPVKVEINTTHGVIFPQAIVV